MKERNRSNGGSYVKLGGQVRFLHYFSFIFVSDNFDKLKGVKEMAKQEVYVITSGEYSDYGINRIFLDRDLAEAYCAVHHNDSPYDEDRPQIEVWEISDESDIKVDTVYKALQFSQTIPRYRSNQPVIRWKMEYNTSPFESKIDKIQDRKLSGYIPITKTITDEAEAIKIISDTIAKYKAEKLGL